MTLDRFAALALVGCLLPAAAGLVDQASAADPPTIEVTIKNHKFTPAEIHVPSGRPAILHITNADDTVEEFDSSALQVEKIIPAGQWGIVRLHPLAPGRFPFMGEYHAETAQGVVVSDP
jgi:Cupredoxin-like domain